nr:MAG TPA: hypothetical protein [Caudoviricetes sp.]
MTIHPNHRKIVMKSPADFRHPKGAGTFYPHISRGQR